jgi:hypothetical protein
MIGAQVQHYLSRARDFLKGMDLLQDDLDEYRSSSALLGIHCAISYCDALRTGMGCADVSSEDHRNAARELRSLLSARRFEKQQGVHRLEGLLSKKSRIAYAAQTVRENEIRDILIQAERFAFWAEETGKKLGIEGWRDA